MDGGAWKAAVHGVMKSQTWLSNFIFAFHFHELEKEMATHSSVLAWRIPGTGEPGGLPSMQSHRAGHDWSDLAVAVACWLSESWENSQALQEVPTVVEGLCVCVCVCVCVYKCICETWKVCFWRVKKMRRCVSSTVNRVRLVSNSVCIGTKFTQA